MAVTNSIVEAQLNKFKTIQSLHKDAEDDLFEKFSIYCVETGYLNSSVDPLDCHLEGDEFGIDGLAISVRGELITDVDQLKGSNIALDRVEFRFYQSKTSQKFDTGDIGKFFDAVEEFFEQDYESPSSQISNLHSIKEYIYGRAAEFDKNPKIKLFYITTGNYLKPKPIENKKNKVVRSLKESNLFDKVKINFVGASELQDWFRSASKVVKKTINFDNFLVLPSTPTIKEAYLGFVEAKEIVSLVSSKNSNEINKSVFFENIRDFNPTTKINKEIINSLEKGEANLFVFRNNGITIVARKVRPSGKKFTITDYQVVNGCQTSHILFHNRKNIDGINVPLRLIEAKNDEDISSIIKGTNRQNPVGEEQFWALTSFMKNFEEYCSSLGNKEVLFIERRDSQYRDTDVEKARIISLRNLMKSVTATLLFVGGRAGRSYAKIRDEYQSRLFRDNHEVAVYHFAAFAYYRLDFLWRNRRIDSEYKIYRFFILSGIGMILTDKSFLLSMSKTKAKPLAKKMTNYISDDEKLIALVNIITKKIDKVIDAKTIDSGTLRDFIKNDEIGKELLNEIGKIKNPINKKKVSSN